MPGGDRTGPEGKGPMTGRRMGYCADNDKNDQENRPRFWGRRRRFRNGEGARGRGRGRGLGRGRGQE